MDDPQNHMKDDFQKSNQLLQNAPVSPSSGRVLPPVPMPHVPPPMASTTAGINMMPRSLRRVPMPMQYHMSPTTGAGYGGAYNSYSYNRPYMNMNMGGYNPYSSYGQHMPNQFQNPVIIAAAENSRPAFESIQSVVQSFNAVSMMLDSTLTAMQMSFQALLGVAENFTRLRSFMMKLYSTIVSFRLARWFLVKLFYLLRLVRGGSTVEEDLWTSLSATAPAESIPSDNRSWPLVVFTGLLVTTPYLMYKFLNSITPVSTLDANPAMPASGPRDQSTSTTSRSALNIAFTAQNDWSDSNSNTISLVKGQTYFTSKARFALCAQNGGWLFVDDSYGRQGYVPLAVVRLRKLVRPPLQHVETDIPNEVSNMVPPTDPSMMDSSLQQINLSMIPEQTQPPLIRMPIPEVHGNSIVLPHPSSDANK